MDNLIKLFCVLTFLFLLSVSENSFAQNIAPDSIAYRYWIFFKDKGAFKPEDNISQGSEAYKTAVSNLTERALWRRSKVLPVSSIVRYDDIPVDENYIKQVEEIAGKRVAVSRWLNGISVKIKRGQLKKIKSLKFVSKIESVHFLEFQKIQSKESSGKQPDSVKTKYNYGPSFWQYEQINVPMLHNYGVTGFNVIVGMCDDGFNWRNHQALRDRKVLGEHDWIFDDDSTLNQPAPNQFPPDSPDQDAHGTETMSSLGGYYPGQLVAPAFDASFYLSKTEYDPTETPVEEDFWLEAAEWMESRGVDVISSSLIYKPFDPPNNSYTYSDMDGKTTIISRAASIAVHLGVVVCNSMGNERQTKIPSIVSPPDADSVIAVGAVDSAGLITYFSSNGPTSDGRIKPDVVAMGQDVWTATSMTVSVDDSSYSNVSGASFSCPITAGVCAMILSAHPELTPMQVKEALIKTANRTNNPDNVFGWGLINAYDAVLYYGMFISNKPEISIGDNTLNISTYIISKELIDPSSAEIYYSLDGSSNFIKSNLTLDEQVNDMSSGKYSVSIPVGSSFDLLKFYIKAKDNLSYTTAPFKAPEQIFIYHNDSKQLEIFK